MFNIGDKVRIKGGKYSFLEGVVTKTKEVFADVKIGNIYCRLMIDDLEKMDAPYTVDEVFEVAQEGDMFLDEDGHTKYIYIGGTICDCVNYEDITEYCSLGTIMTMKFYKVVEHSKLKINKKDLDNIVKLLRDNGYNYEIEEE